LNGEQRKLLVVEDDPGLQSQLRWCFEGYEVILAGDRESALAGSGQRQCRSADPAGDPEDRTPYQGDRGHR